MPDLIMDILETELQFIEVRHRRSQDLLERLGRYWALFGGVGALLVLVQGSGGTGATLVGQAALPLLYGTLLYGLVGGPFGRKLQAYAENETLVKRMTIEGIIWYSPYQNQLGFRLNSTLFDNKEWPSTLLHGQISASRTALFFRIITISMFTFTD